MPLGKWSLWQVKPNLRSGTSLGGDEGLLRSKSKTIDDPAQTDSQQSCQESGLGLLVRRNRSCHTAKEILRGLAS